MDKDLEEVVYYFIVDHVMFILVHTSHMSPLEELDHNKTLNMTILCIWDVIYPRLRYASKTIVKVF